MKLDTSPGSGARAGLDVVSLPATNSIGFIEAAFAAYEAGQVFAVSRPDTDLAGRVARIRQDVLPHPPRRGWARLAHSLSWSDDPAQIVFTSGTEGRPKPIVLSHRNLADVVERLNRVMAVTGEIREYIGVPVTYSFGLGRARAVSAAGGSLYLPERFDLAEIRRMLADGEINAVSGVPSLWQTVLANPEVIGAAGEAARWIEIGSQYMAASDKAAMRRLFPKARIVQHYGLTEASRSTFLVISDAEDLDALESVGAAIGDVRVRITDAGAIAIAGPNVALGQLDETGRLVPLTDPDGWYVTSDRGEIREGRLYYLGRLDDQINVAGFKVGAEALEYDIAALVPTTTGGFAVTAIPDRMRGEAVLLAIEAAAGARPPVLEAAARLALERRGIAAAGALRLLEVAALPRTGTNKIRRKDLVRLWSERAAPAPEAAADAGPPPALNSGQAALAETWRRVLGPVALSGENTFYDAGGDSLSGVQIGLTMEAAGYGRAAIRATLEGRPLAEVAALGARSEAGVAPAATTAAPRELPDRTARFWAVSMTRGVMVLAVLLNHWGPGAFGRLGIEDIVARFAQIFYRMGTPGFAVVFGVGVGAFLLPAFAGTRAAVLTRMRSSLLLVLTGMVLSAIILTWLAWLRGQPIDGQRIAFVFYDVLAYYAIALATAPLWMGWLARLGRPSLVVPFLAIGFWLAWQAALVVVTDTPQQSLLEFVRLMTRAGYNVFKMSALALAGVALGIWFAAQTDTRATAVRLLGAGGVGMLLCILTLVQLEGPDVFLRGGPIMVSLPALVMYLCLAMLMMGGFLALALVWERLAHALRAGFTVLIVIGGLALPIYVFHRMVIPVKDILALLGLPEVAALALALGTFLAGLGYAGRRLYRMYF